MEIYGTIYFEIGVVSSNEAHHNNNSPTCNNAIMAWTVSVAADDRKTMITTVEAMIATIMMVTIKTRAEMAETLGMDGMDGMAEILAEIIEVTAAGLLATITKVIVESPDSEHASNSLSFPDRPANRGRYGNFSEDGPRGGYDRNNREGSFNNQRDDR